MQLPARLQERAPVPMQGDISREDLAQAYETLGDYAPAKNWERATLLAWVWLKRQPPGGLYSLPPMIYEAVKRDIWKTTGPSTFASESSLMFCGQHVVKAAEPEQIEASTSMELVPHG